MTRIEQFDSANKDLGIAQDDIAANAALVRRNAAADAIMFDPETKLELRLMIAIEHCRDLRHSSTLEIMSKVLAA